VGLLSLQDDAVKKLKRHSKLDMMKDEEAKIRRQLAKSTSTRSNAFSASTVDDNMSITLDGVDEHGLENGEEGEGGELTRMEKVSGSVTLWNIPLAPFAR